MIGKDIIRIMSILQTIKSEMVAQQVLAGFDASPAGRSGIHQLKAQLARTQQLCLKVGRWLFPSPALRAQNAMERALFLSQDRFSSRLALHHWLKIGIGWCTWAPGPHGGIVPIAMEQPFDQGRDQQTSMPEVWSQCESFLRKDHAGRYLWPDASPSQRKARIDLLFRKSTQKE